MDMNYTFFTGRLTKDPELRYTPNGVAVCSFTLACERNFASEGRNKETDFHDIVVWRQQGESCANYLRKGQEVIVVGSLQYRYYQPEGERRQKIAEIIAKEVKFGQAPKGQGQGQGQGHSNPNSRTNPNTVPFPEGNSRVTQGSGRTNESYPNLENRSYDPFADPFAGEGTPIDDDSLPF